MAVVSNTTMTNRSTILTNKLPRHHNTYTVTTITIILLCLKNGGIESRHCDVALPYSCFSAFVCVCVCVRVRVRVYVCVCVCSGEERLYDGERGSGGPGCSAEAGLSGDQVCNRVPRLLSIIWAVNTLSIPPQRHRYEHLSLSADSTNSGLKMIPIIRDQRLTL